MKKELTHMAHSLGITIDYLSETESTNNLARAPHYGEGDVILAEEQSGGRGQRGNHWESQPGCNLTFSLILTPTFLTVDQQFYLSKAVALAVADTLERFGINGSIKWPNDLYIGAKKTAGILIENDLMGPLIARSVVGIGLNVNQTQFSSGLPNPTSMGVECGSSLDRFEVFHTLYEALAKRYNALKEGQTKELDTAYLARLYQLNEERNYREGKTGEPFRGTIRSVRPSGELEVEHSSDGRLRRYLFKEIEYTH